MFQTTTDLPSVAHNPLSTTHIHSRPYSSRNSPIARCPSFSTHILPQASLATQPSAPVRRVLDQRTLRLHILETRFHFYCPPGAMAVPRPTTSGSSGNHRSGAPSQASLGSYVPQENPVWPSYLQVDTQLIPLSIHNIPFHPDFGTRTVSHPNLASFVKTVFDDAKRWNPPSWKQTGKYVENKVGLEPVNISQYMTKKHDRWFARYNEFYDGAHDQHWEELDHVLRDNHSDHEAEYTPDVFDHQCLVKWNEGLDEAERASKMKDISMESKSPSAISFYYPPMLLNRLFARLLFIFIVAELRPSAPTN